MENSKIIEKLAACKKQKEAFIAEANRQVAMFNGAVQALEELLKEDAVEESVQAKEPVQNE